MKYYLSAGTGAAIAGAALLLSLGSIPAQAQMPGGSYLETCTNVRGFSDRIIAECRRVDGSWRRTVLNDVGSCSGDISNQNGRLDCARGGRFERPWEGYGSSYDYRYPPRYYYGR